MKTAIEILRGIHDETDGGTYTAASLWSNGYVFHPNCYEPSEGFWDRPESEKQKYNNEEKYWYSKCYVKYKTPNHSYYQESKDFIDNYTHK